MYLDAAEVWQQLAEIDQVSDQSVDGEGGPNVERYKDRC